MTESVKLISVTPNAERHIAYCARVSNPKNQSNQSFEGLIRYCIKNQHWSIFEHAFLTVEINTSLAIATQILRHRSFTFQQFSQRYADSTELQLEIPVPDLRRQDTKNKQNSTDDLGSDLKETMSLMIKKHFEESLNIYNLLLAQGVAKECARFVLPQATQTRLYMSGSIRSWIHYIDLRSAHGTQAEHKEIAEAIRCIFTCEFPTISSALNWTRDNCDPCNYQSAITLE
ncbi:MAG: FAD-dependent thymidylate synthase [Caulobacteraceae bacterium]|nr:FAD-dependent thymidylate synthase [Caulobacteraceae bacterium]